jgi:hypothetical protein
LWTWRWPGLPGSWGTHMHVPCSSTPAGPRTPGLHGVSVLPSVFFTTSAPAITSISGLIHTARTFAVYASQDGSLHHHARLASGCWPGSAGRDWLPAGFHRRVSAHKHPPFPGFSWRTKNWTFFGSDAGGHRAAVIYSLVASCKLCGLDPFAYLRDVIARACVPAFTGFAALTPLAWKAAPASTTNA